MAILSFSRYQASAGNSTNNVTGTTATNTLLTFTGPGIIGEATFLASAPGTFTIRKNGDAATDYEIEISNTLPVLHYVGMALFTGATIEILNPTVTINFTFYIS